MYCIYTLTKVGYDKYHVALLRLLRFFLCYWLLYCCVKIIKWHLYTLPIYLEVDKWMLSRECRNCSAFYQTDQFFQIDKNCQVQSDWTTWIGTWVLRFFSWLGPVLVAILISGVILLIGPECFTTETIKLYLTHLTIHCVCQYFRLCLLWKTNRGEKGST